MPELPEVETIRRQLHERLAGRTIQSVALLRSGQESPRGERFVRALTGRRIEKIDRRAKLLIWELDDGTALLAHLKMTGRFTFTLSHERWKHDRAVFLFDDGARLVWSDVRQFGFLKLVSAVELEHTLAAYGPEPLETSPTELAARLVTPKTRRLKAALLDQSAIAGIGNIYADEACHRAGLRPTRRLSTLSLADRLRLAKEIQSVLRESLAQQGTSANDYVDTRGERGGFLDLLCVYGREGEACKACGTPVKKIFLAQRGTHYCPACQA